MRRIGRGGGAVMTVPRAVDVIDRRVPRPRASCDSQTFSVGAGACLASAEVLRGVDLELPAGESVAVLGPSASGKSTLMLCAAGLLKPESGELKWFGDSSRAAAAHRVRYYCSPADLLAMDRGIDAQLHLHEYRLNYIRMPQVYGSRAQSYDKGFGATLFNL